LTDFDVIVFSVNVCLTIHYLEPVLLSHSVQTKVACLTELVQPDLQVIFVNLYLSNIYLGVTQYFSVIGISPVAQL
jgi:hypothetical protein